MSGLRLPNLPTYSLAGYRRDWWGPDVLGGLSTGAVVIPQAMAYATIAGMPVEFGLYTCMLPMLVYALIGGSRVMSVSTTSTIAVLVATTIADSGSDDPAGALFTLTFMVGLLLIGAWALRLGAVVENISWSVLTGVKIGVGLTVAVLQLPKVLGLTDEAGADDFFSGLASVLSRLGEVNAETVLISAASIALLLALPKVAPGVPGPLVVVVACILVVALTDVESRGVALIPEVPRGLPDWGAPELDHVGALLPGAIAIALMAFLESVSVARGIRRPDEPTIDSGRELFGVGAACLAGSFTHALPSAGGFSQSAVSLRAGARSQLSQVVTVILALVTAFLLAPVLSDLPEAALGAMVIVATLGLVKPSELARAWRINRMDFWVAVATAAVGLTGGLLAAVGVGVALTLLLVLFELNRPHVHVVTRDTDGAWQPDPTEGEVEATPRPVLTLRLSTPLYTANVRASTDRIQELARRYDADLVIVDVRVQGIISVSIVEALLDLDRELNRSGVELWLAGLPERAGRTLAHTTWWADWVAARRVHTSLTAAVVSAQHRRSD